MKNKNKWKIVCDVDFSFDLKLLKNIKKTSNFIYIKPNEKILLSKINDCDAYLASAKIKFTKKYFEKAKNLKIIASPSTGIDHIDTDEARKRNIRIFYIAKERNLINSFTATAEHSIGLLLSLIRHLPSSFNDSKKGIWAREKYTGFQLYKKNIGIIGLGRLGQMVARYCNSFGMNVLGYDVLEKNLKNVKQVSLNYLLKNSDIISIHIHLNNDNYHFIDDKKISKMKNKIIIINTSRGSIIDEKAFLKNLISKKIGGAAVDVIDGEWNKNLKQHPLIKYSNKYNNLIITPHIGGATHESISGARIFMLDKLSKYILKHPIS